MNEGGRPVAVPADAERRALGVVDERTDRVHRAIRVGQRRRRKCRRIHDHQFGEFPDITGRDLQVDGVSSGCHRGMGRMDFGGADNRERRCRRSAKQHVISADLRQFLAPDDHVARRAGVGDVRRDIADLGARQFQRHGDPDRLSRRARSDRDGAGIGAVGHAVEDALHE